jgi:hypothetical protein
VSGLYAGTRSLLALNMNLCAILQLVESSNRYGFAFVEAGNGAPVALVYQFIDVPYFDRLAMYLS